jgi:hypothetical protein
MDQIGPDQHPDVAAEVGHRTGQATAVLATLAEAFARLVAEGRRRQLLREEQQEDADAQREKDARHLRAHGDELAEHAARQRAAYDRRVMAQVLEPGWSAHADLHDLAVVWRTARLREQEFPEARAAAEAVEDRLREIYPRPMDLYDEAVRAGAPRGDAMRTAAAEMARTPVMRPHPAGTRAGALGPAEEPVIGDEAYAAALAEEQIRLATGVDVADYLAELRRLGPGGEAAAKALSDTLAARAGREMAQGRADVATRDRATVEAPESGPWHADDVVLGVGIDEDAVVGMSSNAADVGAANRDTANAKAVRTAPGLAGEWYPEGINTSTVPAHVAGMRPATATPTRTRARTAGRAR